MGPGQSEEVLARAVWARASCDPQGLRLGQILNSGWKKKVCIACWCAVHACVAQCALVAVPDAARGAERPRR